MDGEGILIKSEPKQVLNLVLEILDKRGLKLESNSLNNIFRDVVLKNEELKRLVDKLQQEIISYMKEIEEYQMEIDILSQSLDEARETQILIECLNEFH